MRISLIGNSVEQLRQKFSHSVGLPIREALPATAIEAVLQAEHVTYRTCLFDPIVTLWAFVSQVLDTDRSCRKALSRVLAYFSERQSPQTTPPLDPDGVADTGAYCKARQRLSERVLQQLYRKVAEQLEARVEQARWWCGRRVFLVDGSTLLLPDTPANQAAYPQHPNQAAGCGFPLTKIVAIFSLATGAVWTALIDVWSASETALLRRISACLQAGDVLVGDRLYCTYADIALLARRAVDVVFRLHGARKVDFRKGKRLGPQDRLVTWTKPRQRPKGLDLDLYQQVPETITLRILRFTIPHKGFRPKQITVVTTLLDPVAYPKADVARLYGLRWEVEIDLRHLKTSMEMDMLRTKSPEMARKEIATYLLAYNLLRSLMAEAASRHGTDPLRLSFKGALQHLLTFLPLLALASPTRRQQVYDTLLVLVARERLPDRPGRVEPRLIKRRPKWSRWLQQPRSILKQKLSA